MALDLGQGQVGNVAHQGFEAFVFADPLLNLREQILGDINGTGFALYFEGQVIGQVAFTGLAVAAGAAALSLEGDQAGSDERAVGLELLDARQEVAADQGGMFGYLHKAGRIADYGAGMTDTYIYVTEKPSKIDAAKKYFSGRSGKRRLTGQFGAACSRRWVPMEVRKMNYSSELVGSGLNLMTDKRAVWMLNTVKHS